MRNFTSLPLDDRQRYNELARLELDTQLDLDKRYSDKVKEIRYKELLGIEDIPELDLQEQERQQKDYNFQIQTLFQNLIPFFSNQENIRRYIEQYVKTVDKAFFINSNIEAIKKKLEGTTNLEPSIFEAFISDLYREEEGLTGIETRDYQKRFKILEDKIKALNIYKTDQDIGERLSLIKKEYNKDSLSNMKREKLLTALRTLFETYEDQDQINEDVDELTDLMGQANIEPVDPFSDVFEEMETKRLQQMDDDELEEKFNEFIENFKNSPFFGEKDAKRQFDFEFLIKKFETIPKDKKVEYIDRIQDYLQQEIELYNQEKADEFETIDAYEEDRERRQEEEFQRNQEPEMTEEQDVQNEALQKILYFYYTGSTSKQIQDFVIQGEKQGDDMDDDTRSRIREGTSSSRFQRNLKEIRETVDTFIETFNLTYETFLNEYVYTYQLPLFILEEEMYRNVNGNLRISLGMDRMETNKAVGDYITLMKRVESSFRMGKVKTLFGEIDSDYKTNLMIAWEDLLFNSINQFTITEIERGNFTEIFAKEISDDFLTKKGESIKTLGRRILIGRGILAESQPLYSNFGKFLIHNPSLKEGRLNIKFPSLASHPKFKREKISDKLRQILLELLENNKLSNELYNQLNVKEKETFDRLAFFAGIKEKIGSGIYSREKEEEKEFELLKYQILSGNNSRKGLEKMKRLISKFVKENKMSESDSKGLVEHIDEILSISSV